MSLAFAEVLWRTLAYLRAAGVDIDRPVTISVVKLLDEKWQQVGAESLFEAVLAELPAHFNLAGLPVAPLPTVQRGSMGYASLPARRPLDWS